MTVQILRGDCREVLKTLPDRSVHCCVTSPPYWGLRSYLPPGHPEKHKEIGSEPTLNEWVQTMVEVFREVRRVLRDDGTLWVNFGDAYAGSRCGGQSGASTLRNPGQKIDKSAEAKLIARTSRNMGGGPQNTHLLVPRSDVVVPGLKPKELMGQPWRAAFALQDDGWYLRQDIIWAKRSPMPESCKDRFTKAHEYVFLFSKGRRYYFDHKAIQEPASENTHKRYASNGGQAPKGSAWGVGDQPRDAASLSEWKQTSGYEKGRVSPKAAPATSGNDGAYADGKSERMGRGPGWRNKQNASFDQAMREMPPMRNPRSVRWLASEPFKGAHYATYPPALIEPFILAGCAEGGTVLDPFGGSGTTGLVADRHHRNAILIDLDERNVPMSQGRLAADVGSIKRQRALFAEA